MELSGRAGERHSAIVALERTPLEDEEIYYIIRYAERLGYDKAIKRLTPGNPLQKFRRWLVWIGGWERAELSKWDRGVPHWDIWRADAYYRPGANRVVRFFRHIRDPRPISLFGHFLSMVNWDLTISLENLRSGWGFFCLTSSYAYTLPDKLYWSPNGTPCHERARIFWKRKIDSSKLKRWQDEGTPSKPRWLGRVFECFSSKTDKNPDGSP